ncbi:MAG: hypothetical protein MUO22_01210 [Sedimentisphaerales bacterium]|nr:hypothetical protein [Sedimentisphaerales bacterium]
MTDSQLLGPALKLKKALLPIEEYAARERLSTDIVEKCGKLGVIQIRRFKGKTFVVETPYPPFNGIDEIDPEPTQPADETEQARKISEPAAKVADEKADAVDRALEKNDVSELLKLFHDKELPFEDLLASQIKAKKICQKIAVASVVFALIVLFAGLWFYAGRKMRLTDSHISYAGLQPTINGSEITASQVEALQGQLQNSGTQIENLKSQLEDSRAQIETLENQLQNSTLKTGPMHAELANSLAELKSAQDKLVRAREDFESLKSQNAGAAP